VRSAFDGFVLDTDGYRDRPAPDLRRYDERSCGLSDPDLTNRSLDTWVDDLEASARC